MVLLPSPLLVFFTNKRSHDKSAYLSIPKSEAFFKICFQIEINIRECSFVGEEHQQRLIAKSILLSKRNLDHQ